MFTKRQKKLLSRALRDYVKQGRNRNLESIYGCWHWARCPFDDEMSCQYGIFCCINYHDAVNWAYEMEQESRNDLPYYDCSGRSFISHYHVGRTSDPHKFAIVIYWTLDV